VPQVPENHNLKTNDNLLNGIDLSLMYLPYFSTTEAVPHPILVTKGYGIMEMGQLMIDDIHIVQIFL